MGLRIAPGLSGEIARGPEYRTALRAVAAEVADRAADLAEDPRLPIRVEVRGPVVKVENASPRAAIEEWGSATRAPTAPLRRAVRESGLRLDEAQ